MEKFYFENLETVAHVTDCYFFCFNHTTVLHRI